MQLASSFKALSSSTQIVVSRLRLIPCLIPLTVYNDMSIPVHLQVAARSAYRNLYRASASTFMGDYEVLRG
jgi:hypothetical protein